MSDDKQSSILPPAQDDADAKKQWAMLLKTIRAELDNLTPEQLERVYVAVILMQLKQDE